MARKYARDNRGRFASTGSGATARGGRLKTASGNKRQAQTVKAAKRATPSGAIRKTDVITARVQNGISKNIERRNKAGLNPPTAAKENQASRLARAERRIEERGKAAAARPDTAMANIPMAGTRGRRLDAEISRNVKVQKATARAADKTRNRQFQSDQSRAKKLRAAHVGAIAKAKGISKGQVESALKAQSPSTQIKALKNWVKQNRGAAKPAAKPVATSQKPGSVPLSQVKRYNALDRARSKEKQTYSRELSRVTGSTDRARASAAMPKADLASRKISRIESTMRKLSNSPNTPNVPVLPRARKVGEQITGRRNLYRRVTPTTQAPRVANTVARSRPKPKSPSRKPLTGVNSVVGRNLAGFNGLPVSLRSRKQAASAQAARRRNLLSYNAVSTGGTFKRGVNRQPNLLTGRVDRVGAGKFRPVVKRRR